MKITGEMKLSLFMSEWFNPGYVFIHLIFVTSLSFFCPFLSHSFAIVDSLASLLDGSQHSVVVDGRSSGDSDKLCVEIRVNILHAVDAVKSSSDGSGAAFGS